MRGRVHRRSPLFLTSALALAACGALVAYVLFGILSAWLSDGTDPAPHWLAHPDAYVLMMRGLDYAAVTLFWLTVFLLVLGDGREESDRRPAIALLAAGLLTFVVALVGYWGFSALLWLLVGWVVALAARRSSRRALALALAAVGCVAMVGLYFAADAAVTEAWRERNEAVIVTLPVYPDVRHTSTHTDDQWTRSIPAWENKGESLTHLLLTRWWAPDVAYTSRQRYWVPAATTKRDVLDWYRAELGPEWRWVTSEDSELAGSARSAHAVLYIYAPSPGDTDPEAPPLERSPSYSVEVWNLVPGVTYSVYNP